MQPETRIPIRTNIQLDRQERERERTRISAKTEENGLDERNAAKATGLASGTMT